MYVVAAWVLLAGFSFWGLASGGGPFAASSLGVVALTGLLLAASRAERRGAIARLELLATAVREAHEGVLIFELGPEGPRTVYANAALCERLGRRLEELVGRSPRALCAGLDAEVLERLEASVREGRFFRGELALSCQEGARVYGEVQLSPVRDARERLTHFVATWRDVTEQKQLQSRLVATERIAAVGMVAAGVGHELNNPLAFLVLSQEEAVRSLKQGPAGIPEALARLECAREGAERLRVIVKDLKVFSREGGEERMMLDINAVVVPALRMAAHAVRPRARLVEEFGEPPRVLGSEARLGQVLLNLLVNALQAIPEGHPERHEVRVRTGRDGSGRALVEVSDTGRGMAPSVLARIFDPFFTTRADGEGTGLGLSICQQIVQAHGGELRVRSEEGRGSTFTVLLPPAREQALETEAAAVPLPREPAEEAEVSPRRRILIIDDEPRLAQSMRMLIEPSHDVVVTTRGSEALAWVREGQHFDLVLCDLQMPETTGMDVYSQLRASAPELAERLVFISGGACTEATRDFMRSVHNRILEKPVRPSELLATIDEELACERV